MRKLSTESSARADAQRYWREVHPGVVASAAGYQRHVRRYVQNCPQDHDGPTIGRPLDHDIALEIFFDSVAAMTVAFGEPDYRETVRPDELSALPPYTATHLTFLVQLTKSIGDVL